MNSYLSAIATSRTGTIGYVGACYYGTELMPEQLEMYNWVTVLEDFKNMAHVWTLQVVLCDRSSRQYLEYLAILHHV